MFEKDLADKFTRIFDLKKVTYRTPSESKEQECLFIQVEKSTSQVSDRRFKGTVKGKINVFANEDKLPYGYFTKQIALAKKDDVENLFFFDFEENVGTIDNICERTAGFVYLFDMQYNPNLGELTSLVDEITMG